MNLKLTKRIIIILLLCCVLVDVSPIVTNAIQKSDKPSETTNTNNFSSTTLELDSIPEVLSSHAIADAGHIQRAYDEETDLASVVFRNSDNTNTLYI